VALAALIVGCGNDVHHVPVACEEGATKVRAALAKAPGEVLLESGTKLSDCFTRAAQPSDVQQVAAVFIDAADGLAAGARANPHSPAALQLGYLVGAMRRGSAHTQGIHYETRRRIEQELIGVQVRAPEFVRGERAGQRAG
jgi:hypothetical protein